MSVRPIDGNALLGNIKAAAALHHIRRGLSAYMVVETVERLCRNAPTLKSREEQALDRGIESWAKATGNTIPPQPEAVAVGDAISRSRLLLLSGSASTLAALKAMIEREPALPSIPATPALDVVTVEDVVVGIEWMDREKSERHRIVRSAGDWADVAYGGFLAGDGEHTFSKKAVAAMLSVAESISWPDGHPRNQTPKEPTFLEAAKSILEDLADDANPVWVTVEQEKALRNAIESERERKEVAE